jgi:hypothetical protein
MTTKNAFSPQDWTTVIESPPAAGLIVATAAHGGMLRESIAMAQTYAQARAEHGESELLDEIVSTKPKVELTMYHTPDELKEHGLAQVRDAVAIVRSQATAEELEDYRNFVVTLARKVAAAHREQGQQVSPAEDQAIQEVSAALGASAA